MSSRERWTIYPLLFLALGASLRSRLTNTFDVAWLTSRNVEGTLVRAKQVITPSIRSDELVVERIKILGPDGKPQILLYSGPEGGAVDVFDADGGRVAELSPLAGESGVTVLELRHRAGPVDDDRKRKLDP